MVQQWQDSREKTLPLLNISRSRRSKIECRILIFLHLNYYKTALFNDITHFVVASAEALHSETSGVPYVIADAGLC